MKYWAYINDEVSQQAYSEEELKKIQGFGPDILICSETSAVSSDPEWKPVKELLPHLIKPKAPNFAKFRPKPPMPARPAAPQAVQNEKVDFPIPQNLPEGVTAEPVQGMPQVQTVQQAQAPQNDINSQLLATLEKLNSKISSLEDKIAEQEQELIEARNNKEMEDETPTLISDPVNENDDDVLEVPFDNDFEIAFDSPKSSEEIANEAEAILSDPTPAEIEEYNTDDQKTELMSFGSDMQGILEDTIRQNFEPQEYKKEPKKDDSQFIAEDLVSKTVLDLSKRETAKEKENKAEQEPSKTNSAEEENVSDLGDLLNNKDENKENSSAATEVKEESAPVQEETPQEEPEVAEEQPAEEVQEEARENINTPEIEEVPSVQEEIVEEPQETEPEQAESEEESITIQMPESDQAVASDDIVFERPTNELPILPETKEEDIAETEENNEEETVEENQTADIADSSKEKIDLSSVLSNTQNGDDVKELKIADVEEIQPLHENTEEQPQESNQEQSVPLQETLMAKLPEDEAAPEEKPDLALTMGVTISNDATTAAVLDEIAQEKSLEETPQEEPENLFEEMESNFQEDNQNTEEDEVNADGVDNEETPAEIASETEAETIPADEAAAENSQDNAEENVEETSEENATPETNESAAESSQEENPTESEIEVTANVPPLDVKPQDETMANDDFLKTFATNVEEVFLDQPTAMISDYVPPTENDDKLENIKRIKPTDIKTIPLVPEVMGQEIWSQPYVESATANVGKTSKPMAILKASLISLVIIAAISLVMIFGLMIAAFFGIVPEKYSPAHKVIYSLQSAKTGKTTANAEIMEPETIEQERAMIMEQPIMQEENSVNPVNDILPQVKAYAFADGATLEQRIKNSNPNLEGELEWSIFPTEDMNVYSIAVKVPSNKEGQSFSYRFNYNADSGVLTPTTSEAKNIIESN